VALEQTHMASGGAVLPVEAIDAVADVAHDAGIKLHIDGARLAHAVVATGVSAARMARGADSVSLCLSKALGAPVGSLIAGDAAFVESALRVRKRLGGWMRQSGILAAAGLIALDDGPDGGIGTLQAAHDLARAVATRLDAEEGLRSRPEEVDTNLVLCEVDAAVHAGGAAALADALSTHGVGVMALGPGTLRFVTHRDLDPSALASLDDALAAILSPA
jgi:threonine aldolase